MVFGIEFSYVPMMTIILEPKAGAHGQIGVNLGRTCRIFDTVILPNKVGDALVGVR